MNALHLILAIHNHQPVGNFEHVLEKCFRNSYQPFLDILSEFPSVRLALHYSGPLLQFIERKHPDYIERLRVLARRNQVEMIGGGFYEPILTAIPPHDVVGQIRKMSDWLEENLGQRPRGFWLPERVWEPHLPSLVAGTEMRYTMVDDTHFCAAGVAADQTVGYYITEDNGHTLAIFPGDRRLRYLVPFHLPEETMDYLRQTANREPGVAVTLADDGEKFGVWPETYKWVYEEGYLRRLFETLTQNRDWIRMVTPSEYIQQMPARGRVYLPTASYAEMMEWALPTPAREAYEDFHKEMEKRQDFARIEPFVRGGQWRNFLSKYPEANLIHKKMLHVSQLVQKARQHEEKIRGQTAKGKPTKPPVIARAQDELWQGQCNCAYWHGVFGGLYLNYLRHALYEHLIAAEALLRQASGEEVNIERFDYDADGNNEILIATPQTTIGLSPGYGGSVFEFDFLPRRFNLANVLTRRREAYHRAIATAVAATPDAGVTQPSSIHSVQRVKEVGLERHVVEDWYHRQMFQDHIFGPTVTLETFSRCQYHEMGDFVNQPFDVVRAKQDRNTARVVLRRDGGIYDAGSKTPLAILKTFIAHPDGTLSVQYELSSPADKEFTVWFGCELNFTLLGNDANDFYYAFGARREGIASFLEVRDASTLSIISAPAGFACDMTCVPAAQVWTFPVETVSQSESGMERTYQGSSLTAHWRLRLNRGVVATVTVQIKPRAL